MNDPLSQFHKQEMPIQTASAPSSQVEKRPYEAYDKSGKPCPYTEIRCLSQASQAPQSRLLMAVVFSSDYEEAFTLIYNFMAVEVRGKNLREIRRAMQNNRCEFIQEYHDNAFQKPHKGTPIVQSITFITGEKLNDILYTYKALKET